MSVYSNASNFFFVSHYFVYNAINYIFNLQKRRTPWVAILTSLPMWAVVIAHCGQNWGFFTLLTEMPSYMNSILKFDLKSVSHIICNIQFHTRVVIQGGAAGM
jgi:hypothetical protein